MRERVRRARVQGLDRLCENCNIGTSAAEAALSLLPSGQGESRDRQGNVNGWRSKDRRYGFNTSVKSNGCPVR